MADVLPPKQAPVAALPRQIPVRTKPRLPPTGVVIPQHPTMLNLRNGHLSLDVFSPVNQNGSFEFDRVIKSGEVTKRTRKTKQWKRCYLVLRPNLLSMYKNPSEEKLNKQINLSDLTAVAYIKDPKGRRQHMFGLFSPSRNFHLQADSEKDAREWVELIREEARIDEEEDEILYGSPTADHTAYGSLGNVVNSTNDHELWDRERLASSSPEPVEATGKSTARDGVRMSGVRQQSFTLDYSGNEHASFSDLSDSGLSRVYAQPGSSISNPKLRRASSNQNGSRPVNPTLAKNQEMAARNTSRSSNLNVEVDEDRVIWHGYLLSLKSKGGVRQWKKLWVVLRPKTLAFYKNEEEYAARLIIPLSNIISAVEIDPVSRSKSHCMQVIAEEKSYRFCAPSEEALARWLGALKSQLAKKKEKEKEKEKERENTNRKPSGS